MDHPILRDNFPPFPNSTLPNVTNVSRLPEMNGEASLTGVESAESVRSSSEASHTGEQR